MQRESITRDFEMSRKGITLITQMTKTSISIEIDDIERPKGAVQDVKSI